MDVHQIIDVVIDNYRKDNYRKIYYLLALDIQNKKWTDDCVSVIFDRILSSNYIMPDEPDNDEGFMRMRMRMRIRCLSP